MLVLQFLAMENVHWIKSSEKDGPILGTCPKTLIGIVKKTAEDCFKNGGSFSYEVEDKVIRFSFWSPQI